MSNIVKIIPYRVDLGDTLSKTELHTIFVMSESLAHRFEIEIKSGGKDVDLSGRTVTASFTNFRENTTIEMTGEVKDGKAVVTLEKPCYTMRGQFVLIIMVKDGDADVAVFMGEGHMRTSRAEKIVYDDYVVYDVDALLAQISDMKTATDKANAAAARAESLAIDASGYAGDSNKLGGKEPEHYKQNRTLLINSDFKNPINTLGVTSASAAGLGNYNFINGWSTYGGDSTFEVGNGKIVVTNGGAATCGFAQIREAEFFEAGEVYTLAARVSTTGASRKYLTYGITKTASTASVEIPAETEDKIVVFSFVLPESTDGFYNFRIRTNAAAGGFDIRWMDLYKGKYTVDTLPPHIPQDNEVEKLRLGLYKHEHAHVIENFRYYIDGVNGNDSNDGLSADTAFKTITKWLSLCNSGRNENRCYIVTAGNYEIPYSCFAGLALHITGQVDGVVLDFKRTGDPYDCVFYGTHYNFSNLTLRFEHDECRFETCSVILDKCVFEVPEVRFYDCLIDAQTQCTFPRTVLLGSNANMRYMVNTCTTNDAFSIEKGSTVRVYTEITFADKDEDSGFNAFKVLDSTLWMEAGTVNGSGFATGIYTESSIVGLTPSRYALLKNLAAAPTGELAIKPSLFIAGTTVIGGEYK